jgi:hypothetical protein
MPQIVTQTDETAANGSAIFVITRKSTGKKVSVVFVRTGPLHHGIYRMESQIPRLQVGRAGVLCTSKPLGAPLGIVGTTIVGI